MHLLLFGVDVVAFSRGEGACTNERERFMLLLLLSSSSSTLQKKLQFVLLL